MSAWSNGVYTKNGIKLISKLTQGNSLEITRAITGTGYVDPSTLANQTAVKNPVQNLSFLSATYPENGVCKLPMFLNNDKVDNSYTAHQIGVYANDPDYGEILYFITQSETGTEVPSKNDMPGYSATWTFYFRYGQADSVNITVDPSNLVTNDMLTDEVSKVNEHLYQGYNYDNGNHYAGIASEYGIDISEINGSSIQESEPSPDYPQEIKSFGDTAVSFYSHGYQLFDCSKLPTKTAGGATVTNNGDGTFTVSGEGTLTESFRNYYYFNYSKEYALSILREGEIYLDCGESYPFAFAQINGTTGKLLELNNTNKSGVITQEMLIDDGLHIAIGFYGVTGKEIIPCTVKPMLYQDGNGTWEEFKEPKTTSLSLTAPLRSLPSGVCDTYKDGVITRRIGTVTFDGSESWAMNSGWGNDTYSAFYFALSGRKEKSYAICNKFTARKYVDCLKDNIISVEALRYDSAAIYIFIKKERLSENTLNGFKTWLASNPITVNYELETENTESVTLPTIPSYAKHTVIAYHDVNVGSIKWRVSNWLNAFKTLLNRITSIETQLGNISAILDEINGEGTT